MTHSDCRIAGVHPNDTDALKSTLAQQGTVGQQVFHFVQDWHSAEAYIVVHSSGSTGAPKALRVKKTWMHASALATGQALGLEAGMRALLCISPAYIGGMMMIVRALVLGLKLEVQTATSIPQTTNGADFTAMVPLQVQGLFKAGARLEDFGIIIIGGAQLSSHDKERLSSVQTPVYQTFGMTETVSHIALQRLDGAHKTEYYRALPGVSLSSDDTEALCIEIEHFDHLKLRSNDRVTLMNDKGFIWLGRLDYVINSGGIKIQPERLEAQLEQHLDCSFFVAKASHTRYGETPALYLEGHGALGTSDISKALGQIAPASHRPRLIFSIEAFVRSASGKILRSASMASETKKEITFQ